MMDSAQGSAAVLSEAEVEDVNQLTNGLVPLPADVRAGSGCLEIASLRGICLNDLSALGVADIFRRTLDMWTGHMLASPDITDKECPGTVHLVLTPGSDIGTLSPLDTSAFGEHRISITERGIRISAAHAEGLHRGLATVVQMIAAADGVLPCGELRDRAAYRWRGLSLDVARKFQTVEEVKRVIDVLSLYKCNVLHLHLTDNEGWRLQINSWPKLTSEEFYSQEEFAQIVDYAAERFITVVPEIDTPGHCGAAIRAYPELGLAGVSTTGPFPAANLDPGSIHAKAFVREVLTEVAKLTRGSFIHIGGDESFGMDDAAHGLFVSEVVAFLREMGRTAIGWQETSRAEIGPSEIIQHWIDFGQHEPRPEGNDQEPDNEGRQSQEASSQRIPAEVLEMLKANFAKATGDKARTADKGAWVLASPTNNAYLDRPISEESLSRSQNDAKTGLGLAYYPATELRSYYEWDPVLVSQPVAPSLVLGVEAALWSETITSAADLELLLLPRLSAVAEVAWTARESRGWESYRKRIASHSSMWTRRDLHWFQSTSVAWSAT